MASDSNLIDFDAPEDMEAGGGFLRAEGIYHLIVLGITTRPMSKDDQLIDGWKVSFGVLAGTVEGQKDKTVDLIFFNPSLASKNEGAFAKKKQARLLRAVGLLSDKDGGKKKKLDISQAEGRQCVAKLELDEKGKYLQLSFADIFHVDDAESGSIPKDQDALSRIPQDQRLVSGKEVSDETKGKASKSAASGPSNQKTKYSEPVSSNRKVSLDDI